MISITSDAFEGGTVGTAGQVLIGAADGQVAAVARTAVVAGQKILGTILAVGHRDDEAGALGGTNVFGKAGLMKGGYAIVKIDCA